MTCDPVGLDEIAQRLGVQSRTVQMWRWRPLREPFPEPAGTISARPYWFWPDVKRWAESTNHPRRT